MFIILFETENHKQWVCETYFTKRKDAKKYLEERNFYEENYVFHRKATKWKGKEKAYIQTLKENN